VILAAVLCSVVVGCKSDEQNVKLAASQDEQNTLKEEISSMFPTSELTASIVIDSVSEGDSVRAEQQVSKGTLLMIAKGKEERGHLVVSSTLGQEGDQTFQSNYSIIYQQGEKEKVLLELPAYLFVQPTDKKLTFKQMSFSDADVHILTPQYQTGHGVEGYVFAIDKTNGDAFHVNIVKNEGKSKTLLYGEASPFPTVKDDILQVYPPVGAGSSEKDTNKGYYKLDLKNRQLIAE